MELDRRSVLKASGVAAVAGLTGLAGCNGTGSTAATGDAGSWQYDPAAIGVGSNVFFGSMDYATIYQNRDLFPEDIRRQIEESNEESPVSASEIDYATGVGGVNASLDGASSSGAGIVAVGGSFDKGALNEEFTSEDSATEVEQVGEYEGYTLYESTTVGESLGPSASGSGVVGVGDGTLVAGFAGASGSEGPTAREAVETGIDANSGQVATLRGNNQYAATVSDTVGESTVQFGGVGDPALIDQAVATSGLEPSVRGYVEGLRAGGFGMTLGSDTTTFEIAVTYESADAAENTGLADLVDGLGARYADGQEGINSVSGERDGNTVVITVEGDTETLLKQADSGATGGF